MSNKKFNLEESTWIGIVMIITLYGGAFLYAKDLGRMADAIAFVIIAKGIIVGSLWIRLIYNES